MIKSLHVVFAGLALLFADGFSAAQASVDDRFRCDGIGDGFYTVTVSGKNAGVATAEYALADEHAHKGEVLAPVALEARDVASGFHYVGEGIDFVGVGREAKLTDKGSDTTVSCTFLGGDMN